jgi:hypothetical protein
MDAAIVAKSKLENASRVQISRRGIYSERDKDYTGRFEILVASKGRWETTEIYGITEFNGWEKVCLVMFPSRMGLPV